MMPREVFLEFVAPRTGVIALRTLERLLVQVDAFVSDQMRLLHEAPSANSAAVGPDAVVRLGVRRQLVLLGGRVFAVRERATVDVSGCEDVTLVDNRVMFNGI